MSMNVDSGHVQCPIVQISRIVTFPRRLSHLWR
jgi:hypothetical protein